MERPQRVQDLAGTTAVSIRGRRTHVLLAALLLATLGLVVVAGLHSDSHPRPLARAALVGVPVPPQYAATITRAARSCPMLSTHRLAAQLMAASGFDAESRTREGGHGVAGLTDVLWRQWIPWPSASRLDPAANITALAHHMCDLAGHLRVAGTNRDLWPPTLAAHHSGISAVGATGTIPASADQYVDTVTRYALWYDQHPILGDGSGPPGGSPPASHESTHPSVSSTPSESASGQGSSSSATSPEPSRDAIVRPSSQPTITAAPTTEGYLIRGYLNRCITVPGGTALHGVPLEMQPCTGGPGQRWSTGADGSLRALNMCMELAGESSANGTAIQLARCTGSWTQRIIVNRAHDLVNTVIGKCVDVSGWSAAPDARLQLWTCTGGENQKWTIG